MCSGKHVSVVIIIFAATGPCGVPLVSSHLDIQDSDSVNYWTTDRPSRSFPSRVVLSGQVVPGVPDALLPFLEFAHSAQHGDLPAVESADVFDCLQPK